MARLAKRARFQLIIMAISDPFCIGYRRAGAALNPCQPALVHRRRSP